MSDVSVWPGTMRRTVNVHVVNSLSLSMLSHSLSVSHFEEKSIEFLQLFSLHVVMFVIPPFIRPHPQTAIDASTCLSATPYNLTTKFANAGLQ